MATLTFGTLCKEMSRSTFFHTVVSLSPIDSIPCHSYLSIGSESIDNPDPNLPLEEADSGVKFAAWGQSINRLYTGSSDGVVKVWDVTRPAGHVFVRNILEAQGGIACGVFSWDHTQLVLGDATGHLHLIRASDDDDLEEYKPDTHISILGERSNNGSNKCEINEDKTEEQKAIDLAKEKAITLANAKAFAAMLSQRKFIVPHAEPPHSAPQTVPGIPVTLSNSSDAHEICRYYLNNGLLREYPIPGFPHTKKIGQGPNYDELGMYCLELHIGEDAANPINPGAKLIPQWDGCSLWVSKEQEQTLEEIVLGGTLNRKRHYRNEDLDLDLSQLFLSDRSEELRRDVEVSEDCSPLLKFEEEGRDFIPDE